MKVVIIRVFVQTSSKVDIPRLQSLVMCCFGQTLPASTIIAELQLDGFPKYPVRLQHC